MRSTSTLDLISGLYLLGSVAAAVALWRRGKAFWTSPLRSKDKDFINLVALFLLSPLVVPIHELGHALATWGAGGTVAEFQWRGFWGYVIARGDFTPLQDWWISLSGNLAGSLIGTLLLVIGHRAKGMLPVARALALRAGYFVLLSTFLLYPLMSLSDGFGDWRVIYRFGDTSIASGATALVHVGILLFLFRWNARIESVLDELTAAFPLRPDRPVQKQGFAQQLPVIAVIVSVLVGGYLITQQQVSATAAGPPPFGVTSFDHEEAFIADDADPWIPDAAERIFVHEGVFARLKDPSDPSQVFNDYSLVVVSSQDEAAATGLERAAIRMSFVDQTGREIDETELGSEGSWTMEFMDVRRTPWGPGLWMNDDGALITERQRAKFISILQEELSAAGVRRALVVSEPYTWEGGAWPSWSRK